MRRDLLLVALVGTWASSCASPRSQSPYQAENAPRETVRAERLSREAADLMDSEPERAEKLLREALAADLFYGPAHNNLGVLHLERGELYEAAHEFEWARKLLPGSPDPRINLALVMEQAGRTEEAKAAYEAALEVAPECIQAMQGLASLVVRCGGEDRRLPGWLARIAVEGEDDRWREWAQAFKSVRAPAATKAPTE